MALTDKVALEKSAVCIYDLMKWFDWIKISNGAFSIWTPKKSLWDNIYNITTTFTL